MKREEIRGRVSEILMDHVGAENAIPMAELYETIYGVKVRDKINDTRPLRNVIDEMQNEGRRINSTRKKNEGGYYLARSAHELNGFFRRLEEEAMKKFAKVAAMKRVSLPALLGQKILDLKPSGESHDERRDQGE
ncbi:MAG: hypothetical protein PVG49_20950 [Desulfobacteraceae bacterium]|jgi:hypothetical protein